MWLALDAGNSNVVVAVFADQGSPEAAPKPLRKFRLSTHPIGTADELRARLHAVLGGAGIPAVDESTPIVLASVVPAFTRVAREAFSQLQVIDSRWPFSFKIATLQPEQTGIDRLVNAEAAVREHKTPAILVDSGTATTVCAVNAQNEFLGGAIYPGMEACRDALAQKGAQLFAVELAPPAQAIGRDTRSALQSGLVLGYASLVDGLVRRFKQELGGSPRVIATGGAASLLREVCQDLDELDADLTLRGIAYLYASRTHR